MQTWVGTLAAEGVMFSRWAMSSASLRSFTGARVLWGNRIRRSISDELLTGYRGSVAIDLSSTLPFLEVKVAATGMIFPFRKTVNYCCIRSMLAPAAATAVILRRTGVKVYFGAGVGARAGRDT